jgi:hypothetical protein
MGSLVNPTPPRARRRVFQTGRVNLSVTRGVANLAGEGSELHKSVGGILFDAAQLHGQLNQVLDRLAVAVVVGKLSAENGEAGFVAKVLIFETFNGHVV